MDGGTGDGVRGLLSSPMIGRTFSHKNTFHINTNIGKMYIIGCMIYLSKYINITAINIKKNFICLPKHVNNAYCNWYKYKFTYLSKHIMILTAIDIKIYTIYDPQKIIYQTI